MVWGSNKSLAGKRDGGYFGPKMVRDAGTACKVGKYRDTACLKGGRLWEMLKKLS